MYPAALLTNERRRATGRPDPRSVTLQRTGDPVEEIQPGGVDPPAGLDDERHEVALVPVLGHFYVALRCRCAARDPVSVHREQARRARAYHAHVHQPGGAAHVHLDVGAPLVPWALRRRHPRLAWTPGMSSRMPSWRNVALIHRRRQ